MPKEIVVASWDYLPEDCEQEPLIEVMWQRGLEHVQVVTYSRAKITHDTLDRDTAQFVTLNRTAINQLIRNLRKARDQAFGRDE
jgi:hypothetical protein